MPINRFKLNNNEKKHAARAYRTGAAQSLPNTAVATLVLFNAESYDPAFTFDTTTGKYTVKETGLYHIYSQVSVTIGATADFRMFLTVFDNGILRLDGGSDHTERGTAQSGDSYTISIEGNIVLTVGHLIDARGVLAGPTGSVMNSGEALSYFEIYRIGTLN